jgi:hypothetical protein
VEAFLFPYITTAKNALNLEKLMHKKSAPWGRI